jgi:hypothetical protein
MATVERFELRAGTELWATLCVHPDGGKILEHSLTDLNVAMCPGLGAYDSAGRLLTIRQSAGHIYLDAPNGQRRCTLQTTTDDIAILDVTDPKAQVQLVVTLTGAGSGRNEPMKHGELLFNLRWIAPRV